MTISRLEQTLIQALNQLDHPEVAQIRTIAEAGYADNPKFGRYGLELTFTDGSAAFVRMLGTSPPGGDGYREDRNYE